MSPPFDRIIAALHGRPDDRLTLRLDGVRFLRTGALQLDLELDAVDEDGDATRWRVWADDVLAWRVVCGVAEPLELHDSHKLLRPFQEPWAELTFCGRPHSLLAALGAIWTADAFWSDGLIPTASFFNRRPAELLGGGFGQLAVGPVTFIAALQKALNRFEIKTSVLPVQSRQRSRATSQLLQFGDNFIIAGCYRVEPIAEIEGLGR